MMEHNLGITASENYEITFIIFTVVQLSQIT